MNRIESRTWIALVLVAVLVGGMVFFLWEYSTEAGEWVLFPGSPHVYTGGKLAGGIVTDREGTVVLDLSGTRIYGETPAARMAMLHWLGDRQGNISTPIFDCYARTMSGYDLLNGVYRYGSAAPVMELTLSAKVQQVALEAMGNRAGTVAVYNYRTGELLCALSTPTFDPDNVPDIAGDTTGTYDGVYLNRFVQATYTPGSIFKIVTTAVALETMGNVADLEFTCQGELEIDGGWVICTDAHGTQTLQEAFRNSCNCAFAQLTGMIGREKMARYVEQFRLDQPVSFDGITSLGGSFSLAETTEVEFAWSGIGQHKDQVDPARFLTFLGAIANGGVGTVPHVVARVSDGGYRATAQRENRILSASTAEVLRAYMAYNVETKYGPENFPGLTVCAKSGTAEHSDRDSDGLFAGFVADTEYPLAFFVCIQEGGFGAQACVPVISQVLAACVEVLDGT